MTDSNSTLDDEVDDEPIEDSRETCHFWDSRAGECRYEMLFLGCEPCADCPDDDPAPPSESGEAGRGRGGADGDPGA